MTIECNQIRFDGAPGTNSAIEVLGCDQLTIRNNRVHSTESMIFVRLRDGYNGGPFTHRSIRIINNTVHSTASVDDSIRLLYYAANIEPTAYDFLVRNNILSAPDVTDPSYKSSAFTKAGTIPGPWLNSDSNCIVPQLPASVDIPGHN